MAKKNEVRTMSVILDELNKIVDAYNALPVIDPQRAELTVTTKKLVEEYNELSLLTVFAKCMEAELPLNVETFVYNTVNTKDAPHKEVQPDGSKKEVLTRSVTEKDKMLDLAKFIDWAAERNRMIANSKDWKMKVLTAKKAIKAEWKKYLASKGDSHSVSNRKMKTALQEMFDALIFIPTAKGENSVIADGDIAKFAFGFANKLNPSTDDEVADGDLLPESNWKIIQMKALRKAVIGKKLVVNFNDDEDEEATETAETKSKTEKK